MPRELLDPWNPYLEGKTGTEIGLYRPLQRAPREPPVRTGQGLAAVDFRAMLEARIDEPTHSSGNLLANFVHFVGILRALGLPVTPSQETLVLQALEVVGLRSRSQVKAVCRSILIGRQEDLATFDRAFDLFWRPGIVAAGARVELGQLLQRSTRVKRQVIRSLFAGPEEGVGEEDSEEALDWVDRRGSASQREILRRKDFAELTAEEERQVQQLIQKRRVPLGARKTRRWADASRGAQLDLGRTLRKNLSRGGELVALARRRRRTKPRPLVVLCDVSGSMESYSRILLQFLYAVGRETSGRGPSSKGGGRRETFAFGTRLTRLTLAFRHRSVDQALQEATAAVTDWGGGTRIGEALGRFNRDWAGRVLGTGAVVMVISDGWDRGDPEVLGREVSRLRRTCDRLIWLNPLIATPGYQPLARGMAAALPFVDDFLPVHNLRSLEQLGRHLKTIDRRPQPTMKTPTAEI